MCVLLIPLISVQVSVGRDWDRGGSSLSLTGHMIPHTKRVHRVRERLVTGLDPGRVQRHLLGGGVLSLYDVIGVRGGWGGQIVRYPHRTLRERLQELLSRRTGRENRGGDLPLCGPMGLETAGVIEYLPLRCASENGNPCRSDMSNSREFMSSTLGARPPVSCVSEIELATEPERPRDMRGEVPSRTPSSSPSSCFMSDPWDSAPAE